MNLPTIIFLCGPSGVGKTTLANMLFDNVDGLQAHSFRAPLFNAVRGAFFDCDPSEYLTHEPDKRMVPGLISTSVSTFCQQFHTFLIQKHGHQVLGALAAHFARGATEFFDKVVFDDGDRSLIDDIRFVAKEFGEDNCLIVNILREYPDEPVDLLRSLSIPCIDFTNNFDSPEQMLAAFLAQLANTKQPEPAT